MSEPKGGYIFEVPQSGKNRSVRLIRKATEALRGHRKRQLEERIEHGGPWEDHGLVFPSGVGTPISGGNLNRTFKAMLRRTGLSAKFRFHDPRHTRATLLLSQGVNPKSTWRGKGHLRRRTIFVRHENVVRLLEFLGYCQEE